MNRILFFASLLLFISCGESKQERIEYLESEIEDLESKVYELENENEELRDIINDYESKFEEISDEASNAESYLSTAKSWEFLSDDWDITVTSNIDNAQICISNISYLSDY